MTRRRNVRQFAGVVSSGLGCWLIAGAAAAQGPGAPPADGAPAISAAEAAAQAPALPEPKGAKRLGEPDRVWVDAARHEVLVDGYVSLREGYLEMFACLAGTKEHESVVAVQTKAATVHAALLAAGAKEGRPVRYRPTFEPPTGTTIRVEVRWLGEGGEWKTALAQEWIRQAKTKEQMAEAWVFAGSGFWTDEKTGKRYYMAEGGDFICVSNFTTATLDVPFESSQANDGLLFEAHTERIPPLGTPVRLSLTPMLDDGEGAETSPGEGSSAEAAPLEASSPPAAATENEAPAAGGP